MMPTMPEMMTLAKSGDMDIYQQLFSSFRPELRSYIYRLVSNHADMEDIIQETFLKSFNKLPSFEENSTLKTWVFSIATNLSIDFIRKRQRWNDRVLQMAKSIASEREDIQNHLKMTSIESRFSVLEHINLCFNCTSKSLPIEQQVSLLLKDIYGFTQHEVSIILDKQVSTVKHYVRLSRSHMQEKYQAKCSLVNKEGICYQCSELTEWLNPSDKSTADHVAEKFSQINNQKNRMYFIRQQIIKDIDILNSPGKSLNHAFMSLHRMAMGEINDILEDS